MEKKLNDLITIFLNNVKPNLMRILVSIIQKGFELFNEFITCEKI